MTRVAIAKAFAEAYKPPNARAVQMARMYVEDELTYEQIAEHFGLTRQRVHQILKPFGLPPHGGRRARAMRERTLAESHARIRAGEATLVDEAQFLEYTDATALRVAFNRLGLRIRPDEYEHGTRTRYRHGCHCDLCQAAERDWKRTQRERGPQVHGTASSYSNFGCRCPECKEAARKYRRDLRARRRLEQEVET